MTDPDLDPIRSEPGFIEIMEQLKEKGDYVYILQQSGTYNSVVSDTLPEFTYQSPDAAELVRVREYFQLDTVAGSGDEISRIKNLLAMGFKSRFVTCMPKKHDDYDCHVINAVWSETLDKWIWMDPSVNAWDNG